MHRSNPQLEPTLLPAIHFLVYTSILLACVALSSCLFFASPDLVPYFSLLLLLLSGPIVLWLVYGSTLELGSWERLDLLLVLMLMQCFWSLGTETDAVFCL